MNACRRRRQSSARERLNGFQVGGQLLLLSRTSGWIFGACRVHEKKFSLR